MTLSSAPFITASPSSAFEVWTRRLRDWREAFPPESLAPPDPQLLDGLEFLARVDSFREEPDP